MNENILLQVQPVQKQNRILYLDILRGIAILFIFLANIKTLSGYFSLTDEIKETFLTNSIDKKISFLMLVFVEGKWYSIFSILFGIGFVIQYQNLKKYGKAFVPFFSRRMIGLLLFGLFHLFFLWLGDILALYALIGFVLILFRDTSNKSLLIWAGILLLMPTVHLMMMGGLDWFYPMALFQFVDQSWLEMGFPGRDWEGNGQLSADPSYHIASESVIDFFRVNFILPAYRLGAILMEGRIFKVLACFLIGIWAGRKILNENLLENTRILKKIQLWGFVIGIPMNIVMAYTYEQYEPPTIFFNYLSYGFGVVPLACAYAASVALWNRETPRFLQSFAPVGRMALSNYIFQTLVSISLFYGVGFGLTGRFGYVITLLIALVIFVFQMLFSRWWLENYRFGPLEWVWRQMTYGKIIRNKK